MALQNLAIGAGRTITVSVFESDGSTPRDLTEVLLKWSASKNRPRVSPRAEIYKTIYPAGGLVVTDVVNGVCTVTIDVEDVPTDPVDLCTLLKLHDYDSGGAAVATGTIDLAPGDDDYAALTVVTGDISAVKVGHVLIPAGGLTNNTQPVTVEEIDRDAGVIRTDFLGFTTEAAVAFNVFAAVPELPSSSVDTLPIVRL